MKDKRMPLKIIKIIKIIKIKKKMTAQIYMAREDESEESEPYRGSQIQLRRRRSGDSRTNPKKRKKYRCIHTEQRNSKKTLKK